jgi:hypothetical protein
LKTEAKVVSVLKPLLYTGLVAFNARPPVLALAQGLIIAHSGEQALLRMKGVGKRSISGMDENR